MTEVFLFVSRSDPVGTAIVFVEIFIIFIIIIIIIILCFSLNPIVFVHVFAAA